MLIYKNKATGKGFILIDEEDSQKGLFINPRGTIIELEFILFDDDSIELGEHDEKAKELLNEKQIQRFIDYEQKEKERTISNVWNIIKDLPELEEMKREKPEKFAEMIESFKKQAPGFDIEDFD